MDRLLTHGRILTLDPENHIAEAIGIENGRVAFVDSAAEAEALKQSAAEVVDLGGQTVCPGFIDAHNHFGLSALEPVMVDCRQATSPGEIQDRIAHAAAETAAGRWIRAYGYDEQKLPGRRHLTCDDLDQATTEHPVALIHWSYHRVVANTPALALAGIDAGTPEPAGGKIDRTPGGRPTGLLFESAVSALQRISLEAYLDYYRDRIGALFQENARRHLAHGITTVHDALVSPTLGTMYDLALQQGAIPLNVRQLIGGAGFFDLPLDRLDEYRGRQGGTIRVVGIKLFMDGGGNSIALAIPTDGQVRRTGSLFYEVEEIVPVVGGAYERGLQVAIHACGNRAIDQALAAFETVRRTRRGPAEPRFRIEHYNCPTDELIARTRDLGVVTVVQPVSVNELGDLWLRARIPPAIQYIPLRRMIDAGVTVAGSSDYPCFGIDPIAGMTAAVNRVTAGGATLAPDERIDGLAALASYTRAGARATFDEDLIGTLEPDKQADLVVLDGDPTAELLNAAEPPRVRQTYVAGRLVYQR